MTRSVSSSPTIGVSCGHCVPREPLQDGPRKLYWCETCSAYRMSGSRSTGERGFDFLLELREGIADAELEVTLPLHSPDRVLRLMATLGVQVIEDPSLPRPRSWG